MAVPLPHLIEGQEHLEVATLGHVEVEGPDEAARPPTATDPTTAVIISESDPVRLCLFEPDVVHVIR